MLKRIFIAMLFLSFHSLVGAAQLYRVSVLIFSHLTPEGFQAEHWRADPVLPDLSDAIRLGIGEGSYQRLPDSRGGLKNQAAKLAKAAGYRVLENVSWLQTASSARHAPKVVLSDTGSNPDLRFSGYFRASRSFMFQVDTHMVFTIGGQYLPTNLKTDQFVLKQSMRVKLGEIYYIDHPLFGMLVQVSQF